MNTIFTKDANKNIIPVCKSSGVLSSSQILLSTVAILVDLIVYTNGTDDATVTIYDNTAASGTVIAKHVVKGDELIGGEVNIMCKANIGIYVAIAGTGATCLVRYID